LVTDGTQELRQRIGQLEALHRIAVSMSSSLELDDVLAALARELVSAIPRASRSTVSLITEDGQALRDVVSYSEIDGPRAVTDQRFPLSIYRTTAALLESRQGFVMCSLDDPHIARGTREYLESCGWRCSLELPLVVDGRSVGLVEIGDTVSGAAWAASDVSFIEIVASHAASAIRNAQLHARLRDQAQRDSLTGLFNNSNFYRRLSHAMNDHPSSLAVMVLDLDDFKQVNDTQGHLAGDDILRQTADAIRDWLGDDGVVGRIGGDEFAIILRDVSELDRRAQGLLNALQTRGIRCSLGAASANGGDAMELIKAADRALLQAKQSGKTTTRLAA
jgi:diguanylate cyclase (GGDEF)-like protein